MLFLFSIIYVAIRVVSKYGSAITSAPPQKHIIDWDFWDLFSWISAVFVILLIHHLLILVKKIFFLYYIPYCRHQFGPIFNLWLPIEIIFNFDTVYRTTNLYCRYARNIEWHVQCHLRLEYARWIINRNEKSSMDVHAMEVRK